MELDKLILTIVATAPNQQIEGKKRVHKTLYLSKYAGENVPANFYIKYFGVFSDEVAETLEFLSVFRFLEAIEAQTNGYFTTLFQVPDVTIYTPSAHLQKIINLLYHESTPVLEVASTIAFFEEDGLDGRRAEQKTRSMKPTISTANNIRRSRKLLADLRAAHA